MQPLPSHVPPPKIMAIKSYPSGSLTVTTSNKSVPTNEVLTRKAKSSLSEASILNRKSMTSLHKQQMRSTQPCHPYFYLSDPVHTHSHKRDKVLFTFPVSRTVKRQDSASAGPTSTPIPLLHFVLSVLSLHGNCPTERITTTLLPT